MVTEVFGRLALGIFSGLIIAGIGSQIKLAFRPQPSCAAQLFNVLQKFSL